MKKNVLRIFSLLLIFLVFFTLVSPKVEEEMATLVDAKFRENTGRNIGISNIAVIWPESKDVLFNIIEGTGWEGGLRIAEIPSTYFDRGEAHITLGPGKEYWYIYSASREPVAGGAVVPVDIGTVADTYLLWHPDSIQNLILPAGAMELLDTTKNAALVRHDKASAPFFEHNIWYILKNQAGEQIRIYSLNDVRQFTQSLPWIAGVLAALLASIILWTGLWKEGRHQGAIVLRLLLIAGAMAMIPWILGQFDLPASLMPKEIMLDIPHYLAEFRRITTAMDDLGDPTVRNLLMQSAVISAAVLAGTALLTYGVRLAEHKFFPVKNDE